MNSDILQRDFPSMSSYISLSFIFLIFLFPLLSWSVDSEVTEATYCMDENCSSSSSLREPAFQPIDLNVASAEGAEKAQKKVSLKKRKRRAGLLDAMEHFEMFTQAHPECVDSTSYGLITDMSRGTARNLTHVIKWENGEIELVDSFMTAEGRGVSNECGSHGSPHGFIKMGKSDYRKDLYVMRNKKRVLSQWPTCGDKNPNFEHNRIYLRGMELGYNNNLTEGSTSVECTQGGLPYRYARLHPVGYALGNTTDGCKGLSLEEWCRWAPLLRGGCLYNYDGSSSPAIRKLMSEDKSEAPPSRLRSDGQSDQVVE